MAGLAPRWFTVLAGGTRQRFPVPAPPSRAPPLRVALRQPARHRGPASDRQADVPQAGRRTTGSGRTGRSFATACRSACPPDGIPPTRTSATDPGCGVRTSSPRGFPLALEIASSGTVQSALGVRALRHWSPTVASDHKTMPISPCGHRSGRLRGLLLPLSSHR